MRELTFEEKEEIFKKSQDYLSQRFIVKEEIQLMTEAIHQALLYEFDRKIKLCSLDLHYNFSVEHQIKVLELLENDKKCIKFEISQEEVPEELVDIEKVESPFLIEDDDFIHYNLKSPKIAKKAEEARYFIVEALPNFEEVFNEICGTSDNFYTLSFNRETGNLYVNGRFVVSYKADTIPNTLFSYLFSNNYIMGQELTMEDFAKITGKATQRTFSQIKSDLKLEPAIADLFIKIRNKKLRFSSRVEVSTLTDDEKRDFMRALNKISESNKIAPF